MSWSAFFNLKYWADIIQAASQSPLGLAALGCLISGGLCLVFFSRSPTFVKFLALLIFVVAFGGLKGLADIVFAPRSHRVEIEVSASRGLVSTILTRVGPHGWVVLANCDDTNACQITSANPWRQVLDVGSSSGQLVLDLSDFRDASATVSFIVDGVPRFKGSGSDGNIGRWGASFLNGSHQKDDRGIVVDLGEWRPSEKPWFLKPFWRGFASN